MKTRKRKIEIGIVSDVANFRRKIIIGLATLLMGIFVLPASAQCEAKNDAFKSGEHVLYDLYFNWKFVWVKAGLASLTTNATTYHSEPAYRINLLALGSKRADFFFKMRDTLTCVIGENSNRIISAKVPRKENVIRLMRLGFLIRMVFVLPIRSVHTGTDPSPSRKKVTAVVSTIC